MFIRHSKTCPILQILLTISFGLSAHNRGFNSFHCLEQCLPHSKDPILRRAIPALKFDLMPVPLNSFLFLSIYYRSQKGCAHLTWNPGLEPSEYDGHTTHLSKYLQIPKKSYIVKIYTQPIRHQARGVPWNNFAKTISSYICSNTVNRAQIYMGLIKMCSDS